MKKPWDNGCYGDDFYGWYRWITSDKYITLDKLTPLDAWNLFRAMSYPYECAEIIVQEPEVS